MARKTNFTTKEGNDYFRTRLFIGYDANGKKIEKTFYGKTRKEALEKKEDYKRNNIGIDIVSSKTGSVIKEWLFNIVMLEVKPSTFEIYEGFYRNYITGSHLSTILLSKVTTQNLQVFFNAIYQEKQSATLVRRIYNFINKFFNYQVKINALPKNPCSHVTLPKDNKVKKIEIFTVDEIDIIKKSVDENFDYFIFYFALATGMRQGEIIALTLEDINLQNNSININKTVNKVNVYDEEGKKQRKTLVYPPKSKNSIRTIPIPAQILPMLIEQIEIQKSKNFDLLFTNKHDNMYDGDKLYEKYKRYLKRKEIPHRKFHTLRHTYCSILARNNVPLKLAAELMGHDVEMTSNIYTHLNLDDKKNAIKNITF